MFEPLSRQDQNKTNCSNAKNASVNANIQQPKSIKQFSCKYPCGNCKNAVTWHDEKFGSPQMSQYHDTLCKP
jgi:hypothetical protein